MAPCLLAGSKAELLQMFRNRTVIQFAEFYMLGHKQSNYRRWFAADSPYRIRLASDWAPAARAYHSLTLNTHIHRQ